MQNISKATATARREEPHTACSAAKSEGMPAVISTLATKLQARKPWKSSERPSQ